jgi:hypothetical protein
MTAVSGRGIARSVSDVARIDYLCEWPVTPAPARSLRVVDGFVRPDGTLRRCA